VIWKRAGWIALWGLLHGAAKMLKGLADFVEEKAFPEPKDEEE
jgi:hypothetical protein